MKKVLFTLIAACLLMSSCGSYEASGAYTGGVFGNMMGSAIGGIAGGWRGQNTGAFIGTLGGAVAGAAIGAAHDRKQQQQQAARRAASTPFDYSRALQVRNVSIVEQQRDGYLTRGEKYQITLDVLNNAGEPVHNVYPLVEETTGNKHIHISPTLRIETIGPRQTIRYTATLTADERLRDGAIELSVGVAHDGYTIHGQTQRYTIPTAKAPRHR